MVGADSAPGAAPNVFNISFGDVVKRVIDDAPIPQFLKDAVNDLIDTSVQDARQAVSTEAEELAKDVVGDMMQKLAEEAGEEISNEVKGRAGAGGGAGGNWLVALAKAMGDVAGKHLANAVDLAGKISSMEDLQPTGNETQDAAIDPIKLAK